VYVQLDTPSKLVLSAVDLKIEGKTHAKAKIIVNVVNEGKCDKM
jgi:hypothetical protein